MKKLFTLTMIMLLVFSLVLVSCNANPNENKNTDGDSSQTQTPQTEISEEQKTLLKNRYSSLLPTVASIAEISDMKQEADYTEQRDITIKPTANSDKGFVLLSDDELKEYNKIADPEKETETPVASPATVMVTASEDGGAKESDPSTETEDEDTLKIIEKATNYAEFGFEMEYVNEPVEEEGVEPADATTFSLKNTSFVLKVKLDGETDFAEYDDSSENDNLSISASTMMEEYQALLNIQKKEGTEITMNSFIVKKLLSLVREYKPEINVDTTFGKDKEGRLTADVVLSYEKDGVITVTVKSAEVSLKEQTVITLKDAVFNVTLGDDFNVKATLTSFTSPDDMTELMVDFSSLTIEGGVSVAFENVKLNVPVVLTDDNTINFSFVVTGNGGYNFTTTQITVDNITISDMMTMTELSELMEQLVRSVSSTSVSFLTLGFSYSGKLSDLDLASGKEGLGKFLEGFKVTKFVIATVPVNTEYVNKFMSDNWEKIYDAVQNYLDSVGNDESEILYRG